MDDSMIDALVAIVEEAGQAIMEVYAEDIDVDIKADNSPVTKADLAAHRVIADALATLTPEIPLLSEESVPPDYATRRQWTKYWLIDPLDGTKEFINRNDEFTVNIALIENNEPTVGFVGVPAQKVVYVGDCGRQLAQLREGGEIKSLRGRKMLDANGVTIVASRSHGGERLEKYVEDLNTIYPTVSRTPVGSSLKLCILARGEADLYPRLGLTSEWDIAAAHAVLVASGGGVWQINGEPIEYNKESFLNPEFIAVGDGSYPWSEKLPTVD